MGYLDSIYNKILIKITEFANKNYSKYYIDKFPVDLIKHEIKLWNIQFDKNQDESIKRMLRADLNYPVIIIKVKGKTNPYTIADGLNRLKKTLDIEKKPFIKALVIPEEDLKLYQE